MPNEDSITRLGMRPDNVLMSAPAAVKISSRSWSTVVMETGTSSTFWVRFCAVT